MNYDYDDDLSWAFDKIAKGYDTAELLSELHSAGSEIMAAFDKAGIRPSFDVTTLFQRFRAIEKAVEAAEEEAWQEAHEMRDLQRQMAREAV